MPRISAVVSFHRDEAFLRDALDSIAKQTRLPDEVIIVDDASASGIGKLRDSLPIAATILRHDRNLGIGGARQTGVEAARGDLVAFLDGDDIWAPEKLERQVAYLQANPDVDVVHSGTCVFHRDGRQHFFLHKPELLTLAAELRWNEVLMQTAVMPRDLIFRVGGFTRSRRIVPEWDLVIRLVAAGAKVVCLREPLTHVRRWDHGNISSSGLRQMRRRIATVRHHWPLVRRTLGRRGGLEAMAGIMAEEGAKTGTVTGWGWAAISRLILVYAKLVGG